jgi:hypothetical protein
VQPNQILPALLGLVGVFTFLVLTKENEPDTSAALTAFEADGAGFATGSSTASQPIADPMTSTMSATTTTASAERASPAAASAKPIVRIGGGAFKAASSSAGSFGRISVNTN